MSSHPALQGIDDQGQRLMAYANQAHLQGKRDDARKLYMQLCSRYPNWAFPVFSLGTLYTETDEFGLAVPLLRWSLQLDPKNIQAWNNLGASLRATGHLDDAVAVLKQCMEMDRNNVAAYANLSGCYVNNGTPEQACAWARKGLAIDPVHPQCSNHYALGKLELGEWGDGFDYWERRVNLPGWHKRDTGSIPRWEGAPTGCLAVIGEQGIGDELMFLSVIADAAERCDRVAVEVTPRLVPLLQTGYADPFKNVVFYPSWQELMAVEKPDAWSLLGGLGRLFRRSPSACPGTPYLSAPDDLVAAWRARFRAIGTGPVVGLAWRGGTPKTHGELRATNLEAWRPILDIPGYTFVSVQYGTAGVEAGAQGLPHWAHVSHDFIDHTAQIAACDLVITVCQTAVHQAGALGVKAWCLTPSKPAWRYLTKGARMPWYGSVTQYRQKKDDWTTVIKQVAHDLAHL